MPLHLDYRPQTLDELFGNDEIKNSLKSIFSREDKPHAYLLSGPSGCGKTTIGRIIANMLGCEELDFFEYNSANSRGIDTIRSITENANYSALGGSIKVYLLDEAHQVTGPAANALLKVLEDTPKHVYFILCTTEPEKLLKTIHTRCTSYQVKLLSDKQIKGLLDWVLKGERIKDFPKKVIDEIVRAAEGCPRQALVILDSVIDIEDEDKAIAAVSAVKIGEAVVIDICRGIIGKEKWDTMRVKVKEVLASTEPEKLRYAILGYFSAILLNSKTHDRASDIIDLFSENTYSSGRAGIINAIYLACK